MSAQGARGRSSTRCDIHAGSTPCDLPSLSQTVDLAWAISFTLAFHEIVIVWTAAGADEEGCREQGSGCCADFLNGWNVWGHGSRVYQLRLGESGRVMSVELTVELSIEVLWEKEDEPGFATRHGDGWFNVLLPKWECCCRRWSRLYTGAWRSMHEVSSCSASAKISLVDT